MSAPSFKVDKSDLELIAQWSESIPVNTQRLKELANSIALDALLNFSDQLKGSSAIEAHFYERVQNGLLQLVSCLNEVRKIKKENEEIIKELKKLEKFGIIPSELNLNKLNELEFNGDLEDFKKNVQLLRIEIAKLCGMQNPNAAIFNFPSFRIANEIDRIELAKFYAPLNPYIIQFWNNFQIQNQQTLIDIIKICSRQNGYHTLSGVIKNQTMLKFFKENPVVFLEIIKLCARNDGTIVELLNSLNITNPQEIIEILKLCALTAPSSVVNQINQFPLPENDKNLMKLFCLKKDYNVLKTLQKIEIPRAETIKNLLDLHQIVCPTYLSSWLTPLTQQTDETREEFDRRVEHQADMIEMITALLTIANQELSKSQIEQFLNSPILSTIIKFPRPDLKWRLIMQSLEAAKQESSNSSRASLSPISTSKEQPSWQFILSMLLIRCCQQGSELAQAQKIIEIARHSFFKDGKQHQILLETLLLLVENKEMATSVKQALFTKLLDLPENLAKTATAAEKARLLGRQSLYLLSLLSMYSSGMLSGFDTTKNLEILVKESFQQLLSLKAFPNFAEKYDKTFGASRAPHAIFIYAAKISQLFSQTTTQDLIKFVMSVLSNQSQEMRHELVSNRHLQKIQTTFPHILKRWFEEVPTKKLSDIAQDLRKTRASYRDWLTQKLITDKHITNLEQKEPSLYQNLNGIALTQESSAFYHLAVQLMEAKDEKVILKTLETMKCLPNVLGTEFENDIKEAIISIKSQGLGQHEQDVVVLESEDPIDLLLLGTEVPDSCQAIHGSPDLNKGLLGYLLDGKIRPIVVKSQKGPEGKILGRALLKLLWDGEKPVLYLERFYLAKKSPLFEKAIIKMAQEKAQILGVELVSEQESGTLYSKTLHSLGGPAIYEYSDATQGVAIKGVYKITSAYQVQ